MESIVIETPTTILEVEELTVLRSGKTVLNNIDLRINKGEFVGIVGPNGSGKSTLLLAILGIPNLTGINPNLQQATNVKET